MSIAVITLFLQRHIAQAKALKMYLSKARFNSSKRSAGRVSACRIGDAMVKAMAKHGEIGVSGVIDSYIDIDSHIRIVLYSILISFFLSTQQIATS